MSETTPATTPTKSFLQSKTFWVQVIAALSTFFPLVHQWIAANPESAVGVLAAVNVIVRFVTSGKVSIFPPEDVEKTSGPAGGLSPCFLVMCMAAAAMGMGLSSCTPAQLAAARAMPITATLSYRDPNSGAKAGLTYSPAKKPRGKLNVPLYDPKTGELLGSTDIALGKKPVVRAEK